jgi:hypothetical protein
MNAQEAVTFLARQRREAGNRIRLRTCSIEEAKEMLARFATPEIAAFASREAHNVGVRSLGWSILNEIKQAGLGSDCKTGVLARCLF